MINTYNRYDVDIKCKFQSVRNLLSVLTVLCVCLGILYFFYWVAVMSQSDIVHYTEQYFLPLAKFLNHNDTTLMIYGKTSMTLFLMVIPFFIGCYICDKIEDYLIDSHNNEMAKKYKKAITIERRNNLKQYSEIRKYSICLSVDYFNANKLNEEKKSALNKIAYEKLRIYLKGLLSDISIISNDVFIITSGNFLKFDLIYETVLSSLSKIKKQFEEKYNLELYPSLTTNAYSDRVSGAVIRKNHFDIQAFDFKNKACSTALFAKKYAHLNKNKYMGTPIGEYMSFDMDETKTFELNIISENLSQTLASLS